MSMFDAMVFAFVLGVICCFPIAVIMHFIWLAIKANDEKDDR